MQPANNIAQFPDQHYLKEVELIKRITPHSSEAEQAVLGGLMLKADAWLEVADAISVGDFYHKNHGTIFEAVKFLLEEGHACNIITVKDTLERQGIIELENKHIIEYLDTLIHNTPSVVNIKAYADIVRQKSILRQMIQVAEQISNNAYNPQNSPAEILDKAEQLIFEIAESTQKNQKGFIEIKDVLAQSLDRIDTMFQSDEAITGVPTGFVDLDELTSGLQPSDLIIVAGRPSHGKTSISMNIAEYVAINCNQPVAVFSMEMPAEQLGMRLIASIGRVNQQRVRTGKLEDDDWSKVTTAISQFSEAPLFIDDTPALTPLTLRARARRLTREQGRLGLIVVDYLQLMQSNRVTDNETQAITEISRSLKALAKELHVPVIALSQLNRSVEQRADKRPIMSDLRQSGAIEQDADVIIFIYRDEVYNEDSEAKGSAEIIVGKQRNGPIGTVRLAFQGQFTKFENYSEHVVYE